MNQNKKNARGKMGIRGKLFGYMMLFIILTLGLLWLFQVAFFGQIYKAVRIGEIKRYTADICKDLDLDDSEIVPKVSEICRTRQICALVFDERGKIIANSHTLSDCVIHSMPSKNIYMLYDFAIREGGEKLSRFDLESFRNMAPGDGFRLPGITLPGRTEEDTEGNSAESIIFTKAVYQNERGKDVIVMLNATVSPVAAAMRTLRTELVIISALTVLIAALLSFFMAKKIAGPIVGINKSAKELACGNYGVDFPAGGYREISELSDTLTHTASELSKTGALQRELIANISHDLRTPLTMITGYAEMMRDIPGESTPENLQIIIDEATRLRSLVNDVLDISKISSGINTLELSDFNITETVREVIGRFKKLTEQDGYSITFNYDCNAIVNADRSAILQVIYNFINNAITHSGCDKTVTVTQKVIETKDGKRVRIEVKDNGEGIPPDAIDSIWDRYYKVDKVHKRAQTGSGLGLSIVKGILELHGAEYGVASEVGKGSLFYFEL